jgi:hypothetical protein
MLDPDEIAANYWNVLLCQPPSAWAWEMELRAWTGKF